MNFFENQETIKSKIKEVLKENEKRVNNINHLCEYIGTEHLDNLSEDENEISLRIEKNMKILGDKINEKLQEEEIIYGFIFPNDLEIFDGVFYMYGVNRDDEDFKTPSFSKIPKNISSHARMMAEINLKKDVNLIPWLNEI